MKSFKKFKLVAVVAVAALFFAGIFWSNVSASVPGINELVSVDSSGTQGDDDSTAAAISGNGQYVAFMSSADNLVSGDTNGRNDVFVRDRDSGNTTRVSVSSAGTESDGASVNPRISYDGRYIVFESTADNLVAGVTPGYFHIYVHDMQTGTTSIVDTSSTGTIGNQSSEEPDMNADGRFIVFESSATNLVSGISGDQVFLKDMNTGAIKILSANASGTQGNDRSSDPRISCDGAVVAFSSPSSNLVSGDTNGNEDVFIDVLGWAGDQLADVTISGNNGSERPSVSCNGNVVAYESGASNLVSGDTNGSTDIFSYNRLTHDTAMDSVNTGGTQGADNSEYSSVSDDGRFIVFETSNYLDTFSGAPDNIYIRDSKDQTTQIISRNASYAVGHSSDPVVSADGSYVAYSNVDSSTSAPGNLLSSDVNHRQDVYASQTGF